MALLTNLGTASPISGICNLHIARVTKNDVSGFEGEKPVAYPGLAQVSPSFNTSEISYQADNRTYASESSITSATIQFNLAGSTPEFEEYVLGYQKSNLALLTANTSGPEVVVKYEMTKTNGGSIFVQWGACKFAPVAKGGQTRGNNYQDVQISAAVTAPVNGKLGLAGQLTIDTDSPAFKASGLTIDEAREQFFSNFFWDKYAKYADLRITPDQTQVTGGTTAVIEVYGVFADAGKPDEKLNGEDVSIVVDTPSTGSAEITGGVIAVRPLNLAGQTIKFTVTAGGVSKQITWTIA